MKPRSVILASVVALALGAGCGPAEVSGTAYYNGPDLAYVSPGVSVVADYDYPVFYADNFYWRYTDGAWYRSPVWYGGWYSVSTVPWAVARIDRPWAYSHYRPRYYGGAYYGRGAYGRPYYGPRYDRTGRVIAPRGTYTRPVPRGMRVPVRRVHR